MNSSLGALLTVALFVHPAQAGDDRALSVTIVPQKDDSGAPILPHGGVFEVLFENQSNDRIRIWHQECQFGERTLSFRIRHEDGRTRVMRVPESHPSSFGSPHTVFVRPGEMLAWDVFVDWFDRVPEANTGETLSIEAVFEIKENEQTQRHRAWTGRVVSPPLKVRLVNPELRTPQDYLRSRCPQQALKMLQADPKWVRWKDEDGRTPLDVAVAYNSVDVVQWLMSKGLGVNALANNRALLHDTDDPTIAKLLLLGKPDLSLRNRRRQTALERAASEAARIDRRARSEAENDLATAAKFRRGAERRRQIVKLLLQAGAHYDIRTAIHRRDAERVEALLQENADLANDRDGRLPLRIAARYGEAEICKILLRHGADPNYPHFSPVIFSAVAHPEIVELLLDAGADIEKREDLSGVSFIRRPTIGKSSTVLHYAAAYGPVKSVELVLAGGAEINVKDDRGRSALHLAAVYDRSDILRCLLASDAAVTIDVNTSAEGWTPLHWAAWHGRKGMVHLLLKHGANATARTPDKWTPAQLAADRIRHEEKSKHPQFKAVINAFQEHGVGIDVFTAIAVDDTERIASLLKTDPSLVNSGNPNGYPALHYAVTLNRSASVALLLDNGCNVEIRNKEQVQVRSPHTQRFGFSSTWSRALHLAAMHDHPEIARILIEHKADLDAGSGDGSTPLHDCVIYDAVEVAKVLLASGADVNAKDDKERTPSRTADEYDASPEMIGLLKKYGGRE